jgi:hypothetical protein
MLLMHAMHSRLLPVVCPLSRLAPTVGRLAPTVGTRAMLVSK